jgi:hypothetical protein
MSSVKTYVISVFSSAAIAAATSMVIAKVTAKPPDPLCPTTNTKMPAVECAVSARLTTTSDAHDAQLQTLRAELDNLKASVRLTVAPRYFCGSTDGHQIGPCFHVASKCESALAPGQQCWAQDRAVCFSTVVGQIAAASSDVCATSQAGCDELRRGAPSAAGPCVETQPMGQAPGTIAPPM